MRALLTFNRSISSDVCDVLDTEVNLFLANWLEPDNFLYGLPEIVGRTVTCDTETETYLFAYFDTAKSDKLVWEMYDFLMYKIIISRSRTILTRMFLLSRGRRCRLRRRCRNAEAFQRMTLKPFSSEVIIKAGCSTGCRLSTSSIMPRAILTIPSTVGSTTRSARYRTSSARIQLTSKRIHKRIFTFIRASELVQN